MLTNSIAIAVGANVEGCWGEPSAALSRSLEALERRGIFIISCSNIYRTAPHAGAGLMPDFYNLVVHASGNFATGALIRLFKEIERDAGRRMRPRWSARPLDLDLLDHGGRVLNWPTTTRLAGPIILPHPLLHKRGFVLVPLVEINPHWHHPVLQTSAATLLSQQPHLRQGIVRA